MSVSKNPLFALKRRYQQLFYRRSYRTVSRILAKIFDFGLLLLLWKLVDYNLEPFHQLGIFLVWFLLAPFWDLLFWGQGVGKQILGFKVLRLDHYAQKYHSNLNLEAKQRWIDLSIKPMQAWIRNYLWTLWGLFLWSEKVEVLMVFLAFAIREVFLIFLHGNQHLSWGDKTAQTQVVDLYTAGTGY